MFNMGGPIKQGIMHGIREPHKHGGPTGTGLVGDQRYPKTKGREHHGFFLPALYAAGQAALRMGPAAYRGYKASRYMEPWAKNLGWAKRARQMFLPRKGVTGPKLKGELYKTPFTPVSGAEKAGFGIGSFAGTNPGTTIALASGVPQAGYGAYKGIKAAPGGAWGLAKRYAAAVVPGDQSHWYTETPEIKTVAGPMDYLQPGYKRSVKEKEVKELSDAEKKAFANKKRNERVDKYLKLMGYDRSKKMAVADALIDASKIVGDRGSLDPKNISQELINPIIQATSKRLDKPQQIREAVGLMAAKAEIEKDMSAETDALDKKYKRTQIAVGQKSLERGFEKDMADFFLGSRTKPDKKQTETYARIKADEYGLPFTKVTNEEIAKAPEGASKTEIIQSVVGDDGIYMVGNAMIKVTGGVPKVLIGA